MHRFHHWLTRVVAVEALLGGARREIHRVAAEAIEAAALGGPSASEIGALRRLVVTGGAAVDPLRPVAAELVRHYEEAGEAHRASLLRLVVAAGSERAGRWTEAQDLAALARDGLEAAGDGVAEAAARVQSGLTLERSGRAAEAAREIEAAGRALQGADGAGDTVESALVRGRADSLRVQVRFRLGDYAQAVVLARELLVGYSAVGATPHASLFVHMGNALFSLSRLDEAEQAYRSGIEAARVEGNLRIVSAASGNLANVFHARGEFTRAIENQLEALRLRHEVGDRQGEVAGLNNLGSVRESEGALEEAESCFRDALVLARSLGDRWAIAGILIGLGSTAEAKGRWEPALAHYRESIGHSAALGLEDFACDAHAGCARVQFRLGDLPSARRECGRASAIAARTGYSDGSVRSQIAAALVEADSRRAEDAAAAAASRGRTELECEGLLAAAECYAALADRSNSVRCASAALERANAIGARELAARALRLNRSVPTRSMPGT